MTEEYYIKQKVVFENEETGKVEFEDVGDITINKDFTKLIGDCTLKFLNQANEIRDIQKYDKVTVYADYTNATTSQFVGFIQDKQKGFDKHNDSIIFKSLDILGLANEFPVYYEIPTGGTEAGTFLYNILNKSINTSPQNNLMLDLSQINTNTQIRNILFNFKGKKLIDGINKIKEKTAMNIWVDNSNHVRNEMPSFLTTQDVTDAYELRRGEGGKILSMDFGSIFNNINRVVVHYRTDGAPAIVQDDIAITANNNRVNELVLQRRAVTDFEVALRIAQETLISSAKNYIINCETPFIKDLDLGQNVVVYDDVDSSNQLDGKVFMVENFTKNISKQTLNCNLGLSASILTKVPENLLYTRTGVLPGLRG